MIHGKHQTCCASLLAALFIAAAPGLARAELSSGGEYAIDSSLLDNGGGAWLNGGRYSSRGAIGQTSTPEAPEKGGIYTNRSGFYNPPYLTYQKGLPSTLSLYSGEVSLSMPANAVTDRGTFDIGINKESLNQPLLVERVKVDDANRKMAASEGAWAQFFESDLTEMYIFDEENLTRDPLKKTGVLSLRYRDLDGDGIIDGSNPEVSVDTLNAWVLDEKTRLWALLPSLGVDKDNRVITVNFQGPGVYNMIGTMAVDVSKVFATPVPFRPNGPNAGNGSISGQTGTEADGITFRNVGAQSGNISIYTLSGQLVTKIDIASKVDLGNKTVNWNVKNDAGSKVASGVYIWRAVSGSASKTGKLMIIW